MEFSELQDLINKTSKQDLPIETELDIKPVQWEYDEEFLTENEDQYWRYVTMLGQKFSEETKQRMSEAKKGKTLSDEHKKKIGDAHRGKVYNEETRKKMSESHKGQKPVVTDQMREKLRVANTGKVHSDERKAKIAEGMRKAHERRKQRRQLGDRGSE